MPLKQWLLDFLVGKENVRTICKVHTKLEMCGHTQ